MQNQSNNISKYLSGIPFYKKKILCRAPYTAVRLSLNGNILICCANKEFVIGKYPDDNLHHAWFSNKIGDLRKSIKANDLSMGCNECLTQIELGNFSSVKAAFYNNLSINKNGYPSLIEFELDNNCNLECIMCNPHTSSAINKNCNFKEQINNPYLNSKILEDIVEFIPHLKHANFIGGEPFLIPLYYEMWEKMLALNKNIRFNISTNGTVLNNKIKSILEKGKFDIAVSIDSIDKNTFETIRKNAHLEDVLKNIEYFKNYCKQNKTYFSIWVCPMIPNAYEIPELTNHFSKENIPVYFNNVTTPHSISLWYQNSTEINSLLQYYQNNRIQVNNDNSKRFNNFINQLKLWKEDAVIREDKTIYFKNKSLTEISTIYFSEVFNYLNSINCNENYFLQFQQKLGFIIIDKNDLIKKNIMIFLLLIPIKESIEIIMSNNLEYINYYVDNNF